MCAEGIQLHVCLLEFLEGRLFILTERRQIFVYQCHLSHLLVIGLFLQIDDIGHHRLEILWGHSTGIYIFTILVHQAVCAVEQGTFIISQGLIPDGIHEGLTIEQITQSTALSTILSLFAPIAVVQSCSCIGEHIISGITVVQSGSSSLT